jgi:hypothetical protein
VIGASRSWIVAGLLGCALACARQDAPQPLRTVDAILIDSGHIILNSTTLPEAIRLIGPATITYAGEGIASLVCYRLSGAPATFVYLEALGVGDVPVVTVEIGHTPPEVMPRPMTCQPTPRNVRGLATTFGFSLGATRAEVQKVLGTPSSVEGGFDLYTLQVDTSSTAAPKRLRPVYLSLSFKNDSVSSAHISKGNTLIGDTAAR